MKKNKWLFAGLVFGVCVIILFILKSNYSIKLYIKGDGEILHTEYSGKLVQDEYANVKIKESSYKHDKKLLCKTDSDKLTVDICDGLSKIYTIDASDLLTYTDVDETYPQNPDLVDLSFDKMIDKYINSEYMVLISTVGDGCTGLTEENIAKLRQYGVYNTPIDRAAGNSYVCVINGGNVCYVAGGEDERSYTETFSGHKVTVTSAGNTADAESKIKIDGKDYSFEKIGINVVVYDTDKGCLVDSINFNTQNALTMTRNYSVFYKEYEYNFNDKFFSRLSVYSIVLRCINYGMLIIIVMVVLIVMLRIRKIAFAEDEQDYYKTYKVIIWHTMAGILIAVSVCLPYGLDYLKSNFEDVSFSQLLYHMTTNLDGTNWDDFSDVFINIGFRIVIAVLISVIIYFVTRSIKKNYNEIRGTYFTFGIHCICIMVCCSVIFTVVYQFNNSYNFVDYVVSQNVNSQLYEDYYVNPQDASIEFPEKKKNLIYVFMESMEITNASYSEGGGKTFNCIPELTEIANEYDCFNGNSGKLNGALTLGNTGWTVAGMVAQTSGVPLNVPIDGNSYGTNGFLPGDYSIGQILEDNGYNNCLLIGSNADFGGRASYFTEHGDYEICDYEWAKKEKLIPSDYNVWWGYEDKKLFEYAKKKATKLAKEGEPFNLTILTADTHFTDGYYCEDCEDNYNSQYANVLACSSKRVSEFLSWLQEQDFYDDTVVVLSGDHLCMDSLYYDDVPDNYDRKTFVSVINSAKNMPMQTREFSTMDMFPTTLSALGCKIEGDRLGLGTDLYSQTKTLTEELGVDNYEYQLSLNSKYYNHNIYKIKN